MPHLLEQVTARIIDERTFVTRTRSKRTTYWLNGERVTLARFVAAESVSEGAAAWKTYSAQQGASA